MSDFNLQITPRRVTFSSNDTKGLRGDIEDAPVSIIVSFCGRGSSSPFSSPREPPPPRPPESWTSVCHGGAES